MAGEKRGWWNNCDVPDGDEEVAAIDAIEDSIAPLDDETKTIRRLIACLESCHHKAARWAELIIEAIGSGRTTKGEGTRPPGKREPIEQVWQNCAAALAAWRAGCPAEAIGLDVGGIPARELIAHVGERTPLKEWQVGRIVDKVREYVVWPRAYADPTFRYVGIEECGTGYQSAKAEECPQQYADHADFWNATIRAIIHDTVDGEPAEISLAAAIDHLQPCNWNFLQNLAIVLKAVGGDLLPERPFAAHARNIRLTPIRDRMKLVADTLRAFCQGRVGGEGVDSDVLRVLGEKTPVRHWLAASFEKTLRLQLGL